MITNLIIKELDNKTLCELKFNDMIYPSAENAFQSSRFTDFKMRQKFTYLTPYEAEYRGNRFKTTVNDWELSKINIMRDILTLKFSEPEMKKLLLATGNDNIVIVNHNHEHEWGVCTCQQCHNTGENMLGKLLMDLRSEFQEERIFTC